MRVIRYPRSAKENRPFKTRHILRNIHFHIVLLIIATLFTQGESGSLPNNLKFSHYTTADGLSQSHVICTFQDSRGFMWFGTQDGLNRFDGYNFKIYKHNPADTTSLSENWIWSIYEDSNGYLWVGTFGGGACRFNPATESFTRYLHDPQDSTTVSDGTIWAFCEYPAGVLWVGANNGLNRFHPESETFTYYKPSPGKPNIFNIFPGKEENLWMSTDAGIYKFDIQSQTFDYYGHDPDNPNSPGAVARQGMAVDTSGIIWLATADEGINRFDPKNKTVTRYQHDPKNLPGSILSDHVLDVHADHYGTIWAATNKGLSLLSFEESQLAGVRNFQYDPLNPHSLSGNYLSNIYEGSTGEIWVSAPEALNRFDRHNRKFDHYQSASQQQSSGTDEPNRNNGLSHNIVLPILASRKQEGILWIGTRNGLNRLDLKSRRFTYYFHDPQHPESSIISNYILSLHEDSKGRLWIGTRAGGLTRITFGGDGKEKFKNFRHNPDDPRSIGSANVHYIYEDLQGTIWVGTGGGGLNRFNPNDETFLRYPTGEEDTKDPNALNDLWAYNMLEDRDGLFWIGTAAGGLNLFDRNTGIFKHYMNEPSDSHSLSNNRVLGITETRSGELWIATAFGLNKLIRPENADEDFSFIQYHEADGLPNDVIYGVLEDDSGNLWASTNKGLCKIHFDNGKMKVRVYTAADGLQGDEFNHNSYHKGADGRMYFGGSNGFNAFYPDSVKDNPNIPPIVITEFRILNEAVPLAKYQKNRDSAEKVAGNHPDEIELSYKDNVFSFEFAALNYTMPEKNRYAYMMEGFDKNWIYCGTRRFVTYTNLDPGDYLFRVKGSNNDGVWNEGGASIAITIMPPPWKTWWAFLIYAVTAIGVVAVLIRYRVRARSRELEAQAAIEHARAEEREQVRKKSSADFHDEAGNILTKITLFTELAKRKIGGNADLNNYLRNIEENTKALSGKMRDFIWVLDPEKDSLYDTLIRLKDFGSSLFEYSEISFHPRGMHPDLKKIDLPVDDRRTLLLIFKEAMNNSLKHSQCKTVLFEAQLKDSELIVTLSDDGSGFDSEVESQGYGLKNMEARAQKINAVLEISSNKGEGTSVCFKKPITQMGN